MSKTLRIAFDSTFYAGSALYLGVSFWESCLKGLLPKSLHIAVVLSAAAGFFLVLRWLKKGESPKKPSATPLERRAYTLPNSVKAALESEDVWGRPLYPAPNDERKFKEKCEGCAC